MPSARAAVKRLPGSAHAAFCRQTASTDLDRTSDAALLASQSPLEQSPRQAPCWRFAPPPRGFAAPPTPRHIHPAARQGGCGVGGAPRHSKARAVTPARRLLHPARDPAPQRRPSRSSRLPGDGGWGSLFFTRRCPTPPLPPPRASFLQAAGGRRADFGASERRAAARGAAARLGCAHTR